MLGIYYCEKWASQRPSKVIYDRADSAIVTASVNDFDRDKISEGVIWFHFTGITPALSDEWVAITLEACKKAGEIMSEVCLYVDYCIANEEDAKDFRKRRQLVQDALYEQQHLR